MKEKFLHLYKRVAGYFTGMLAPELTRKQRMLCGVKALACVGVMGLALLCLYVALLIPFTPSISELRKAKVDQPAQLMSSDGKQIAIYKRLNHELVELKNVSPHVVNALIATEDHRFYSHHGIDLLRTAASAVRTLTGRTEGGSTITQQLARNLYPEEIGRKRSINRKIKEAITALKIELVYSKKEILEKYLNTVPFLYNAFGIEMAARTYFDKPSSKLTVLESATLIGMLKGNSYYNPMLNPERAVARRNVVLAQMVKHNMLSQENFDVLKNRELRLEFERQPELLGPAPHFAEYVRKWLIEWADRNDYNIYSDGLVVHTTLDSRLQAIANQAVKRQLDTLQAIADVEWGMASDRLISKSAGSYPSLRRGVRPFAHFWKTRTDIVNAFIRESNAYQSAVKLGTKPEVALAQLRKDAKFMEALRQEKTLLQTGLVAIEPATGQVRAWVGSRDYETDQYDHVARAQRQPGSTFKPFVYGAALEQGLSPNKRYLDQEVEIPMQDGTVWRPTDASAPSGREMSMREGLAYSKNTITAQVMQDVGTRKTVAFARKSGVNQSKLEPVPALALGTSPVTLLEMVSAYGTFANKGEYRRPAFITRITDRKGNLLAQFETDGSRALSEKTAADLTDMLRGVIRQGTGTAIRTQFGIRADVAGKTGTTQNNTDGWFILMHPQLVAGSWVGFNDSRVTMRSDYWGQGAHNALNVVGDFFQQSINTRLIEGKAQLAKPRDDSSKSSIWDSVIGKIKEWFGADKKEVKSAPKVRRNRSKEPSQKSDGMNQIINQVQQEEKNTKEMKDAGIAPNAVRNRPQEEMGLSRELKEELIDPDTLEPSNSQQKP
ncbi:MAG: penicillin-binding protein [Burkholderiaceae bacterium]|nr:penicillin-binding protein [Burkholderiaceae bacterium]